MRYEGQEAFYKSHSWYRVRDAYKKQAKGLCERCLAKGKYEPAYIVHHKTYLTDENFGDPELMFGFDNLECLCLVCHNEEHGRLQNERRWKFVDGELVTRDE